MKHTPTLTVQGRFQSDRRVSVLARCEVSGCAFGCAEVGEFPTREAAIEAARKKFAALHGNGYPSEPAPGDRWPAGWVDNPSATTSSTPAQDPSTPRATMAELEEWANGPRWANFIGVSAVLGVIGLALWGVIGLFMWFGSDTDYSNDGPTGKYTETECLALRALALADTASESDREDAAVQYDAHCE